MLTLAKRSPIVSGSNYSGTTSLRDSKNERAKTQPLARRRFSQVSIWSSTAKKVHRYHYDYRFPNLMTEIWHFETPKYKNLFSRVTVKCLKLHLSLTSKHFDQQFTLTTGLIPPVIPLAVKLLHYLLRLRFSFLVSCPMTVNRFGNQLLV